MENYKKHVFNYNLLTFKILSRIKRNLYLDFKNLILELHNQRVSCQS